MRDISMKISFQTTSFNKKNIILFIFFFLSQFRLKINFLYAIIQAYREKEPHPSNGT